MLRGRGNGDRGGAGRRGGGRGQGGGGRGGGGRGGGGRGGREGGGGGRGGERGQGGGRGGGGRGQGGGRGGRSQGDANTDQDNFNRRYIGYQKLASWANETNPDELVLLMIGEIGPLSDLLKKVDLKPDWYDLLIIICSQVVSVNHQKQGLKKVLTAFVTSHFFGQGLHNFVTAKTKGRWPDAENFYRQVLNILKEIIGLLPQHATHCQMPLLLIQQMVNITREMNGEGTILVTISDLQKEVEKKIKSAAEPKSKKRALPFGDTDTPPENFRELSVVPEVSDLRMEAEPFVRAILSKGSYRDEDHYLDIQFRLMREDFIQPLREGINEFIVKGGGKGYKSSDIRLYFNVRIIGMSTGNGIKHVLEFDIKPLKSVNWDHSKRFLNGSLLCLSNDNFDTVYFATVGLRNTKDLKNGIINVDFKSGLEDIFCTPSSETFVMAETTAYFEAYCPVLKGLQEMDSSFSHQKYFIYCTQSLKPPEYLLGGIRHYNLSSLTKIGQYPPVPVLNTMSWPPVERLNLNESQRDAVQLALTKELAIIQGPPGTGKTYVGLKVMKVLLENQINMMGNDGINRADPILVVCFTNHALDQFLEGVLEFCPTGIVRVGGRSSSMLLEDMNLRNLTKNKQAALTVRRALYNTYQELRQITNEIKLLKTKIDSLYLDVMSERVLEEHMIPAHQASLNAGHDFSFSRSNSGSNIKDWLNAPVSLSKGDLSQMVKKRLTELVLKTGTMRFIDETISIKKAQKTIKSMSMIERAQVYQGWLHTLSLTLKFATFQSKFLLAESKTRILTDSEISQVIPEKVFNCIFSLTHEDGNDSIEKWLLGLESSLNDQLDDIESLIQFHIKGSKDEEEIAEDVDEVEASQNDRMIDVDKREEQEIAEATREIKDGDAYLLIKAEKLGIKKEAPEEGNAASDGWLTVTHKKPISFSKLISNLTSIEPMTDMEEDNVTNLWTLEMRKRFSLYNLWISRYRSDIAREMEGLVHNYEEVSKGKDELRMETDIEILKGSRVIGMTTTGAAKHRALLQAVACRIIVVEEAAEVLEAHIITSLNKNCKHLILIGDHQQLKPNPTVYALAKDYNLDLSLFERLINNGIQHVTLKAQHRMRPSISKVMRHIYPQLEDHVSVKNFDHIRGVKKDIFFINHGKYETDVSDSKSKSNAYEASYLVALLNYLLLQGYKPSQISILATYVGQILMIKNILKEKKVGKDVRVTTVDNFQGEENDIILLSLVRSNVKSNAGFLKVDNRVCVALSRAKKGLYAIGNFDMLYSQSDLWKSIIDTAECEGIYGNGLPVGCPNHENFIAEIRAPEDFHKKFPDGGCGLQCDFRLLCGHKCPLKCHGYDPQHQKVRCVNSCSKTCSLGHPCKKRCIDECGDCMEVTEKIIPRCGHTANVICHVSVETVVCSMPCPKLLNCQHACPGSCGGCFKNKKHAKCQEPVEYFWTCCTHICKVPCYMKPLEYPCPSKCQAVLECGHECEGTCSRCANGMFHMPCKKECSKYLPCGHRCSSMCGLPCPPCQKECSVACRHSKCSSGHACGEKCVDCHEPCLNQCEHQQCTKKCFQVCDIEPCNKKCKKILKECQHPCAGVCGEMCVCTKCSTVSVIPESYLGSSTPLKAESDALEKTVNKCQKETVEYQPIPSSVSVVLGSNVDGDNVAMPFGSKALDMNPDPSVPHKGKEKDIEIESHGIRLPQKDELEEDEPTQSVTLRNKEEDGTSSLKPVSVSPNKSLDKDADELSLTKQLTSKDTEQEQKKDGKDLTPCLIKIPSCGHVFFLKEFDRYINSQTQKLTPYLPCPICKKEIQNCFRYNKTIKWRYYQREGKKQEILDANRITLAQRDAILESQVLLQSVDLSGAWFGITIIDVGNLQTSHEMVSLDCIYKYALVISDLQRLDSQSKYKTSLTQAAEAVQKLNRNLTEQQKCDYQNGLKNLLLAVYISKFEETPSAKNETVEKLVTDARASLKEKRLTQETLKRLHLIIEALETKCKATKSFTISHASTKKVVVRDMQILDSEEMLCNALKSFERNNKDTSQIGEKKQKEKCSVS